MRIFEGGIGDGARGFTRVQFRSFPGSRMARDVRAGKDLRATRAVDISVPLLKETGDECGTTLVAGRSIATPFVGAFAGAVLFGLTMAGPEGARSQFGWAFDLNHL